MSADSVHMVFSPQSCSLALLDALLTEERRALAEQILHQIRSGVARKTSSHTLIVGPRGCGKTHLLAFVRKTLEASGSGMPELILMPLAEEEHGLTTLLDFLLAALRSCGHDIRALNPQFGAQGRELALFEAIAAFDQVTAGRAVLILLENLNAVFAALEEGQVDRLRAFLQSRPRVALLASAVELFADSSRPDHPFHGFFSIQPLQPLSRKEARAYLAQLAGSKGDEALEAAIRGRGAQQKVDAIYDLTGGNHRLLAMLNTFLTVEGFAELVGPFVQMVDRELTPYYQQRLDRLSPQQKKILMAIAGHHGRALSVKEIANYTFSSSQVVSRQLADLIHGAHVRRTRLGRESLYELNEPLLRLVLDIKEGRDRPLPLIVAFLRRWYDLRELRQLEDRAPEIVKKYYATAVEQTMGEAEPGIGETRERTGAPVTGQVDAQDDKRPESEEVSSYFARALALEGQGRSEEAIAVYDEVLRQFGTSEQPELLEQVARALVNKGIRLGRLNRSEEAIAVYDEVLRRFGTSEQPELLEQVARALAIKGFTLGQLNRSVEEIAVYDEVLRRFGTSERPELLERVARALVNKGFRLGQLNRSEEGIAVYDEVLRRFGTSERPELLTRVARVLVNKGITLGQLNRSEEAIAVYDEVLRRFGSSERPEVIEDVARALVSKGLRLGRLNRSEEAIAVYDEVLRRFGSSERPELIEEVASALISKGLALEQLNRSGDAIALFGEVVRRLGSSERSELLEQVARALVNKGFTLAQLNRSEEAIAVYDEVLRRYGSSEQPELREAIARALVNKGITLGQLNRSEEAIAVYDEVLHRFGTSERPELLEQVVWALVSKASLELEQGRLLESLALSERALSLAFHHSEALQVRLRAMFRVGDLRGSFQLLHDQLSSLGSEDPLRSGLVRLVLEENHANVIALRELADLYRDEPDPLSLGLLGWVQEQLPMSEAKARTLEKSEQALAESLGPVPGCSLALQLLSAVRRHASGERDALFRLPLEIRRLVSSEPE